MAGPFENFTPEMRLMLGAGILSGNNLMQGVGLGAQNAAQVMATQKQETKAATSENQTRAWLQKMHPNQDFSQVPSDMLRYAAAETMKQQYAKPAGPDYQFIQAGNQLLLGDKNSGTIKELGNYASPPELPAIAKEYDWAKQNGFNGTPQEYQMWKANLSKQKGMTVEYDPETGFRMTQGDVDPAKMPKLTEAEGKNAGFYKRALSAEQELGALEGEGTSLWNATAGKVPVVGNGVITSDAQKFNQAQRNFINAVLRRESGAVISPEEFENAKQQYFPQPFDGPEVITQKKKNRSDAIAGFEISSGPAAERVRDQNNEPKTDAGVVDYKDFFK